MEKPLHFKIVLVGDSNVGKTSIINSFVVIKFIHSIQLGTTTKLSQSSMKSVGVDYVKISQIFLDNKTI